MSPKGVSSECIRSTPQTRDLITSATPDAPSILTKCSGGLEKKPSMKSQKYTSEPIATICMGMYLPAGDCHTTVAVDPAHFHTSYPDPPPGTAVAKYRA